MLAATGLFVRSAGPQGPGVREDPNPPGVRPQAVHGGGSAPSQPMKAGSLMSAHMEVA